MERSEVAKKVIDCVRDSMGLDDGASLSESTTLKDLGADSFDQLEIMVALEEAFGISLEDAADDGDISDVATIGQAVDLVESRL